MQSCTALAFVASSCIHTSTTCMRGILRAQSEQCRGRNFMVLCGIRWQTKLRFGGLLMAMDDRSPSKRNSTGLHMLSSVLSVGGLIDVSRPSTQQPFHSLNFSHVDEVPVPEAVPKCPLHLLDCFLRQPSFLLQAILALRRSQPPGQRLAAEYGLHKLLSIEEE